MTIHLICRLLELLCFQLTHDKCSTKGKTLHLELETKQRTDLRNHCLWKTVLSSCILQTEYIFDLHLP